MHSPITSSFAGATHGRDCCQQRYQSGGNHDGARAQVERAEPSARDEYDAALDRTNQPGETMSDQIQARCKVWIERDGSVLLSEWRIELLAQIDETGSLTKAAVQLDVPYRTAWQRIKEMEARLGHRLVLTESGGSDGGGSQLTDEARELVRRYHRVTQGIAKTIDERVQAEFGDLL